MLGSINQDILNEQIQGMNVLNLPDLEVSDQNFYMGNNVDQQKNDNTAKPVKRRKKYSPTKVKARSCLSDIFYKRLTAGYFANKLFITDCTTFI